MLSVGAEGRKKKNIYTKDNNFVALKHVFLFSCSLSLPVRSSLYFNFQSEKLSYCYLFWNVVSMGNELLKLLMSF